ncbi:MAG: TIGR03545 family protein [Bdellovibrio sp.]|nr:MAG: TIGR03545 family protein [Bdellovibrio sp.]
MNTTSKSKSEKKAKGPIRTEAVVPVILIVALIWGYFHFFFDHHLRRGLEFVGYQVMGAEVNIEELRTSFWDASLRIKKIELTDAQQPQKNMLEVGDVRFAVLWDGLLRARFVVNEMAVDDIRIGTPRKAPGKVKPPEPKSDKPGFIEKESEKLKNEAVDQAKKNYDGNVLGDIASLLGGESGQVQLGKIEGTLASKQKLQELDKAYKEKGKVWDQKLKSLPQQKEIQALGDRLGKIKSKDFKSPQELGDSLKEFQSVMNEADQKVKVIQATSGEFNNDYQQIDKDLKGLDDLVKKDTRDLESRFHIPKLDAKEISQGLFRQYMGPYLAKIDYYQGLFHKYFPPPKAKKESPEPDPQFQPHPRAKGVTYEFGRQNSYPWVWVKKVSISSQTSSSPSSGSVQGTITDISSNQALVGRPTVATVKGDFSANGIRDFLGKMTLDLTQAVSLLRFEMSVGSYPVAGREVVQSPEVNLAFQKASGQMAASGELVGMKDLKMELKNKLQQVSYEIKAKNPTVQEIMRKVFLGIPEISMNASVMGTPPDLKLDISSNVGSELQKGFEEQIKKKIDEAKQKIQAYMNEQVGAQKAKLESEVNKYRAQVDAEIGKLRAQVEGEKSQAQSRANDSKKRAEEQGKQQIQQQGKKALDDLKKKLGF